MSSFKRKGSAKQAPGLPGTSLSPATSLTTITSMGIPSLDDILGGGLPLSCSLLIAAPDLHTSYGDLVQKYFIAQGLVSQHSLLILDDNAESFMRDIMWSPSGRGSTTPDQDEDEKIGQQEDQKIKIAWRYEKMKPFQTTVPVSSSSLTDEYCHNFDLGSRVPTSVIDKAFQSGRLSFINVQSSGSGPVSISEVLNRIRDALKCGAPQPIRICIPALGSPSWGELRQEEILYFLHSLRAILRQHPTVCASISLAPHLTTEAWGGRGWLQKLGWVTDAALTLAAFSADPSLTMTFPNHHGFLHIHTLPAPHSIIPPSDKFSALRGLSASAGGLGGSGENNLTFKSTRKRLIFETLHLDIEGGVGERRTTPSAAATVPGETHDLLHESPGTNKTPGFATVQVVLENPELSKTVHDATDGGDKGTEKPEGKPKKPKKRVAFRADRPDLYDF
ncbi:hypothetical protein H2248_000654 [Termitomyces sp. 'cryptogamus']|nr:hypothetical protein H2248_000654 [Termitomyces sp. 'cryptogamus']